MRWRDGLLLVVSLLAGPPIAALVILVGFGIAQHGPVSIAFFDPQFYLASIPFSYLIAWLPMLIAAAGNVALSRLVSEVWRLLLALPAGAAPFVVQLGWLAEDEGGVSKPGELLSISLGGALASLVCVALVEAFGPEFRSGKDRDA